MVKVRRKVRLRHFPIIVLVLLPFARIVAADFTTLSSKETGAIGFLPFNFLEMMKVIRPNSLQIVSRETTAVGLHSFTSFCKNYVVPEIDVNVEPECVRWEEQELDMLLMYMDLLSTGMNEDLASKFYEEIRCLSRANIYPIPELRAWEVCFSYDYSNAIGSMLAKYVIKDMALKNGTEITSSERFIFKGKVNKRNRGFFIRSLLSDSSRFRLYSRKRKEAPEDVCCKRCTKSNYFVNVEKSQCKKNPFGKHCCHKACKSLGRLKIGASSSTSFCCRRCRPLRCAKH